MEAIYEGNGKRYVLTRHAKDVMRARGIYIAWIEKAFFHPSIVQSDLRNPLLERRFGKIPEFGDRVLRVVVNMAFVPPRILSVFFDRAMKGKL